MTAHFVAVQQFVLLRNRISEVFVDGQLSLLASTYTAPANPV